MLTEREIFDKVKNHLLAQGKRSTKIDPTVEISPCAYRGTDGLKCAIGCLIPDKLYFASLEGNDVQQLAYEHPEVFPNIEFTPEIISMLYELQIIHDSEDPEIWEAALNQLELELFYEGKK